MLLTVAFVCFAMLVLAWVFLPAEGAPVHSAVAEERVAEQTAAA